MNFDCYEDARFELNRRELEVEEIRRGYRTSRIPDKNFNELCDYWISHRIPLKRNSAADLSIIRCHLRPAFSHLQIRQTGVSETDQYQAARSHLDRKTIANHLTLLISMLNLAVDLHWLEKRPKI